MSCAARLRTRRPSRCCTASTSRLARAGVEGVLRRAGRPGVFHPTLPAFPRIGRDGTIAGTAAARGSDDGRLTGDGVAKIIKRTARRAGIEGEVGGHSLRRGFATSARAAGANHLDIARQGGWADGSRAVYGYIEEVDRFKNNPLRGIGL